MSADKEMCTIVKQYIHIPIEGAVAAGKTTTLDLLVPALLHEYRDDDIVIMRNWQVIDSNLYRNVNGEIYIADPSSSTSALDESVTQDEGILANHGDVDSPLYKIYAPGQKAVNVPTVFSFGFMLLNKEMALMNKYIPLNKLPVDMRIRGAKNAIVLINLTERSFDSSVGIFAPVGFFSTRKDKEVIGTNPWITNAYDKEWKCYSLLMEGYYDAGKRIDEYWGENRHVISIYMDQDYENAYQRCVVRGRKWEAQSNGADGSGLTKNLMKFTVMAHRFHFDANYMAFDESDMEKFIEIGCTKRKTDNGPGKRTAHTIDVESFMHENPQYGDKITLNAHRLNGEIFLLLKKQIDSELTL